MADAFLGLGSNVDPEQNIRAALDALADRFGSLQASRVFQSEAVGFTGRDFYNMVVGIQTNLSPAELVQTLRAIEDENGRDRSKPRFSPRTLDIDVLTYADFVGEFDGVRLPRQEILKNAFVLWPLAELVPDHRHPELLKSYADLWRQFDKKSQKLEPVDFVWRGEPISHS